MIWPIVTWVVLSPFLKSGMTLAILNDCGTQPFANGRLNMNCKGSTIWLKTALSSLGPILSGTGDLLS